jgi:hypothetical protein
MGGMTLVRGLAVAAAWMVTGVGVSATASPDVPDVGDLLGMAVRSSHATGYRGTQTVLVWDSDGSDAAVLDVVVGGPGRMRVEVSGTAQAPGWVLLQRGEERTVYGPKSSVLQRAPAELLAAQDFEERIQRLLAKYTPVLDGPTRMLGRDAWRVRILRTSDKQLVERWTIDAATGVILEREGFERRGRLERLVSFSRLEVPYDAPESDFAAPPAVGRAAGRGAGEQVVSQARAAREPGFRAPDLLPAGYHLESGTRFDVDDAEVIHFTYSDGLEPLSLFRQRGVLQRQSLPRDAAPTKLRKVGGFAWEGFPRGLAWQDGQGSFVLVGAASTDELVRIANALPQSAMRRSIPQRVGHFFRWLRAAVGRAF